jgi:hypothetical protein
MTLDVSPRRLARRVWCATAVVACAGLLGELVQRRWTGAPRWLGPLFSLSYEGNLPSWYSAMLLFGCSVLLGLAAADARRSSAPHPRRWALLALVFLYMSLDEAAELHEHLGGLLELHGALYFSWVVPAAVVVAVLGVAYLPFLRDLPVRTRWRFIVAGVIYVGGALLMELPLGWWTERAGDDNLVYALLDFVEESLELAGTSLFLAALLDYLGGRGLVIRVGEAPSE